MDMAELFTYQTIIIFIIVVRKKKKKKGEGKNFPSSERIPPDQRDKGSAESSAESFL